MSNEGFRFSYFNSVAPRDAIINQDLESFSSLIVMPAIRVGYKSR